MKKFLLNEPEACDSTTMNRLRILSERIFITSDGLVMRYVGPKGKPKGYIGESGSH